MPEATVLFLGHLAGLCTCWLPSTSPDTMIAMGGQVEVLGPQDISRWDNRAGWPVAPSHTLCNCSNQPSYGQPHLLSALLVCHPGKDTAGLLGDLAGQVRLSLTRTVNREPRTEEHPPQPGWG